MSQPSVSSAPVATQEQQQGSSCINAGIARAEGAAAGAVSVLDNQWPAGQFVIVYVIPAVRALLAGCRIV